MFNVNVNLVNLLFFYELAIRPHDLQTDFILKVCLFGVFKLTKNAYPEKYSYSAYGIEFDWQSHFLN